MSVKSIGEVFSGSFITSFKTGSGSSSPLSSNKSLGSSDQVSLTLDSAGRTLAQAFSNLNEAAGFLNLSIGTLEKLDKIVGKVITLGERGALSSTSASTRSILTREYEKLGKDFAKVLKDAKVGDYNALSEEDIAAVLTNVGLDPEQASGLAKIFKRFITPSSDKDLASQRVKGKRPINLPSGTGDSGDGGGGGGGGGGGPVGEGTGDGTFQPRISISLGPAGTYDAGNNSWSQRITDVTAGDLNGDGYNDLVSTNNGTSAPRVQIALSNGNGSFGAPTSFDTITSPTEVKLYDFTGDSELDMVVSSYSTGSAVVYVGNGNGTFGAGTTLAAGPIPDSNTIADFNNDGKADIVFASSEGNTVSVLLGNGNGTFQAQITTDGLLGYQRDIGSADFNGDGKQDLVVTNSESGAATVLLGNGNGTFAAGTTLSTTYGPYGVATGDINGDGKSDFVVGDGFAYAQVFLGNGNGTFQARLTFNTTEQDPRKLQLVDLNADSKLDLVVNNNTTDKVTIMLGNGNGTFAAATSMTVGAPAQGAGMGGDILITDLNNDGLKDILTPDGTNNTVSILRGNGTPGTSGGTGTNDGTFEAPTYYGSLLMQRLDTGDFNGDGVADFVGNLSGGATVTLLGNADGTFQAHTTLDKLFPSADIKDIKIGDFNNDGNDDVATVFNSVVATFYGNGNGTFSAASSFVKTLAYGSDLIVGDINNDGIDDLLVGNQGANADLLLGNGNGTFQAKQTFGYAIDAASFSDATGDGIKDILVSTVGVGVRVLQGNGNGTYGVTSTLTTAGGNLYTRALTGDFNNDSIKDIIYTDYYQGVQVALGNGNGSFAAGIKYNLTGQTLEQTADLNGDGNLDTVGWYWTGGDNGILSVMFGNGNGTFSAGPQFNIGDSIDYAIVDKNGDGIQDIVASNMYNMNGNKGLSVILGNGTPASGGGGGGGGGGGSTEGEYIRPPTEYPNLFSPGRNVLSRSDSKALAEDAKKLRKNIRANIKTLQETVSLVGRNMDLTRGSALAMLDGSRDSNLTKLTDAEQLAGAIRGRILGNVNRSALSELGNIDSLVAVALVNP